MSRNISMAKAAIPLLIAVTLAAGCERRPKGVLSEGKMVDLLADMAIAQAYEESGASRALPDSVRRKLSESVLMEHGVDQATLDSTYAWYGKNVDKYYNLYDKVTAQLDKKRKKVGGNISTGVENDVWMLPKHILFSPLGNSDLLVFEFPGEAMQKGESLEWRMRLSSDADAEVILGVDYEDGSTSLSSRKFRSERRILHSLVSDTGKNVKRIYGSVKIPASALPVWLDSITMGRLPYDSLRYANFRSQRFSPGPKKKKTNAIAADTVTPGAEARFASSEEMQSGQGTQSGTSRQSLEEVIGDGPRSQRAQQALRRPRTKQEEETL